MANGLLDKRNDYLSINDYMSAYDDGIAFNEVEVISTPFITYVDSNFFKQFEELKYVNLPNLRSLAPEAFNGCSKLKEAHFINMNYISGARVFNNCINLSKITFSKELNIGPYAYQAFCSCYKLESVPYIVANDGIPATAFCDCSSLKKISAHCSGSGWGKYINDHAFYGCINLTEASFDNFNAIASYAFYNCKKMFNISIPKVTVISQYAFANCEALEFIDLPECENIYYSAFYGCSNLTSISTPLVRWLAPNGYVFENCNKLKTLSFPRFTSLPSGKIASNCQNLKSIYFDNVVSIGSSGIVLDYTGNYDIVLSKIQDLPSAIATNNGSIYITNLVCNGVTSVSRISTYYNVYSKLYVSNLYINNCEYIYSKAFESAQFINIHAEKCKEIYSYAFSACSNLEGLNFPNCVLMPEPILYGSYPNIKYLNFKNIISLYNDGLFATTINYSSYGSLSYMNFHNLVSVGAAFLGHANVVSDVFIDLTNCTDFNFIQGSSAQHYINNLSLPNLIEISATNFNSEQTKYFIGYTPSSSWWRYIYASNSNIQLSIKSLYLDNIENINYTIAPSMNGSSIISYIRNIYISSSVLSGHSIYNFLSSSIMYDTVWYFSPLHNIENLYMPKCKTFNIDMGYARLYHKFSTYSATWYMFSMTDYLNNLETLYAPNCEYINAIFANSSINIDLPKLKDGFIGIYNNQSSIFNIGSQYSGVIRLHNLPNLQYFDAKKAKVIDLEFLSTLSEINVKNVEELNKIIMLDISNTLTFNFEKCRTIETLKRVQQSADDEYILGNRSDYEFQGLFAYRSSVRILELNFPVLETYNYLSLHMGASIAGLTSCNTDTTFLNLLSCVEDTIYMPKLSSINRIIYDYNGLSRYYSGPYDYSPIANLKAKSVTIGLNSICIGNDNIYYRICFTCRNADYINFQGDNIRIDLWNYGTFYNVAGPSPLSSKIQSITIPNLSFIGSLGLAFTSYSSSIDISHFSNYASYFDENLYITTLDFPKVTHINRFGLYKLMNLEKLNIESCESLEENALYDCPNVSYLYLPNISNISTYGLPSNIELLRLGSIFVYPHTMWYGSTIDIITGINSDIEKFLQVPESMYSQYSNHSAWQSIFNNHDAYKWNLIAY